MALIGLKEIFDLIVMTAVIGYIFTGKFAYRPRTVLDMMNPKRFDWRDFKFSVLVTAPAIVIHELAHKFVAMGYGLTATFQMFPLGLAIGVFLKLINSPFLILAPGFVSIPPFADPVGYRLIAFAGPFVNLVLWIGSLIILKTNKKLSRKKFVALSLMKYINMILFFFNMIPFGPFDGAKVLFGPS